MEISQVRFEAFKSLYDVTCHLDHLTVLTGPNGAGKSNLVDALNFLGEVYTHGLEFAVSRAGGYENIAHRRTRRAKRPIAITVEVKITADDLRNLIMNFVNTPEDNERPTVPDDTLIIYRHSFSLKTADQSLSADFEVGNDQIEIEYKSRVVVMSRYEGLDIEQFLAKGGGVTKIIRDLIFPFGDRRYVSFFDRNIRSSVRTNLLTEQMQFAPLLAAVKRAIGGTRIFQLSPFQCRASGVPTPNAALERYGENLPGAADHLIRNSSNAWSKVQRAMRAIMPNLLEIGVAFTEDRRLALQFREDGIGRPWTTGEVSDGTIQALALYIALFDTRNPMIVIEEPENAVHPWILRQFLDFCNESPGKQIFLTSHSPVLLNYVRPSIVQLMTLQDGRSRLRPLMDVSPELAELVNSGEISLFDGYDSGLVPGAVPPGLV